MALQVGHPLRMNLQLLVLLNMSAYTIIMDADRLEIIVLL